MPEAVIQPAPPPLPARPASGWPMARDCLAATLLVALLAAVPLLGDPRAYYLDDYQAQFMPTFYAIGETLWNSGQIPLLTLKSWVGGNLLGEYQYALLNPVLLGLFALLPLFDSLPAGAAFLSICALAMMGGGSFFLARTAGVSRPLAFVAAVAMGTNAHVFYWYASSWIPGLLAFAFLPWAMAFLLRALEGRWSYLAAGLFTALTATAGWPMAVLALGVFVAAICAVRLTQGGWREVFAPASAALLGLLMAMPAIGPMLATGAVTIRPMGINNAENMLVPALGDVLALSHPFHQGWMTIFRGYGPVLSPLFYVAWFILPVLVLLDWRKVRWSAPNLLILMAFAALMLLASQGPSHLGPLRWPFRYLVYFDLAVICGVLLLLSQAGLILSARRLFIALGAVGLSGILALQSDPGHAARIMLATAALLALAGTLWLLRRAPAGRMAAFLVLTTAGFAVTLHAVTPRNGNLPDWQFLKAPARAVSLIPAPKASTFVLSGLGHASGPERFDEILFGQMGLVRGMATVNGYSPIGHKGLSEVFCFSTHGTPCPEAGPRLFQREPETGATFADLMRVDRIVAQRGLYLQKVQPFLSAPWQLDHQGAYALAFTRPLPHGALPGTVSFPADGMGLEGEGEGAARATFEQVRIVRRAKGADLLVFARTWWPGYAATLNGHPVPIRRLGGFLVAVDLPADGETGLLTLSWRPERLMLTLAAALAGLAGLVLGTALFRTFRRLILGSREAAVVSG